MIRLHHCIGTRSDRILWLLYELGVDFDLEIHPFDETLRRDPYRSLHPAGRVPALEMDGHTYLESGAIAQILCERFDPRGLGRPVGHAERAKWLVWIHFAETISAHCANLSQQHILLREDAMRSPIIMKLEAARLGKTINVVEAGLSGDTVLKGGFSAADICVGQAIDLARHFVDLEGSPRVASWFVRLSSREGYSAMKDLGPGLYTQDFYAPWPVQ